MALVLGRQAGVPACLGGAGRDGVSGCGGDAGPGDVLGGELVEGGQGGGEFGGRAGPGRCHERPQDVVVDLGVEAGEQQAVAGEGVVVWQAGAGSSGASSAHSASVVTVSGRKTTAATGHKISYPMPAAGKRSPNTRGRVAGGNLTRSLPPNPAGSRVGRRRGAS